MKKILNKGDNMNINNISLFSDSRCEKKGPITNSFYNDFVFSEEQTFLLRAYHKMLKKPETDNEKNKKEEIN
jgi:hypothetical protein